MREGEGVLPLDIYIYLSIYLFIYIIIYNSNKATQAIKVQCN